MVVHDEQVGIGDPGLLVLCKARRLADFSCVVFF